MKLPLAAEGWPFILGALAVVGILVLLRLWPAAAAALVLALFVCWFFRDPERSIPPDESLILSSGDGKVIEVTPLPEGGTKVGIFLSVFDVHVNRVPVSGTVKKVEYRRGRFLAAWNTIASEENERCSVIVEHERGTLRFVQVAGLIARRIICRLEEDQKVARGDRYGLIRFGSRVDIYLPREAEATVKIGDRVRGGADAVGRWSGTEAPSEPGSGPGAL